MVKTVLLMKKAIITKMIKSIHPSQPNFCKKPTNWTIMFKIKRTPAEKSMGSFFISLLDITFINSEHSDVRVTLSEIAVIL